MVPPNLVLNVEKTPAQFPLNSPIQSRFKLWKTNLEFFRVTLSQCVNLWSRNSESWQQLILLTHPNFANNMLPQKRHHSLTLKNQIQLLTSTIWQCSKILPLQPNTWQQFNRK